MIKFIIKIHLKHTTSNKSLNFILSIIEFTSLIAMNLMKHTNTKFILFKGLETYMFIGNGDVEHEHLI